MIWGYHYFWKHPVAHHTFWKFFYSFYSFHWLYSFCSFYSFHIFPWLYVLIPHCLLTVPILLSLLILRTLFILLILLSLLILLIPLILLVLPLPKEAAIQPFMFFFEGLHPKSASFTICPVCQPATATSQAFAASTTRKRRPRTTRWILAIRTSPAFTLISCHFWVRQPLSHKTFADSTAIEFATACTLPILATRSMQTTFLQFAK